jgi:hypothetical protein
MTEIETIFYSWQSDLPKTTNQNAIRQSLRSAINLVEDKFENLRIELDEATRNTTGSPNIPSTIFDKISKSDIFICDLTTINNDADIKFRKTANPNVLIELGYAISKLGWERIILLFNTQYGTFPNDLPFDIDRHRASKFKIRDKSDKNGKNDLTQLLKNCISPIIKQKPLKPSEKNNLTPSEIKRIKDLENLRWIMSSISLTIFDNFIENMPMQIIGKTLYFQDWFNEISKSSKFHIYDSKLSELLFKFRDNWELSLSFYQHYNSNPSSGVYNFNIPFDVFPNEQTEKDFNQLTKICIQLKIDFSELLDYLRKEYIELDLDETSQKAYDSYIENIKKIESVTKKN